MLVFTTRNIHRTITCESGQLPSRKSFFFGIGKLILYLQYCFHFPCTVLLTLYHITCTVLMHGVLIHCFAHVSHSVLLIALESKCC